MSTTLYINPGVLRDLRLRRGLSMEDAAEALGVRAVSLDSGNEGLLSRPFIRLRRLPENSELHLSTYFLSSSPERDYRSQTSAGFPASLALHQVPN